MKDQVKTIKGDCHADSRGTICFVNDFDMSEVKRFYIIKHTDVSVIRGWRAHRTEQRWFHVLEGAFLIRLVQIDDWIVPSKDLPVEEYTIAAEATQVLHIPKGYGSLIQALSSNSKLLVFADHGIENAKHDNYVYPTNYFDNNM